jgi:hypothetical protein
MIFVTAVVLALVVGLQRSAALMALVAVLIAMDFALAALVAPGAIATGDFAMAVAGYNLGLAAPLAPWLLPRHRLTA